MADRVLETMPEEVPELPELLEKVIIFALEEMKEKMEKGEDIVPFTCLVVKDNLFMESHPGDTPDQCFADARHTVEGARGADAYAMGYDGYIETDEGVKDALIAEGGMPGDEAGHAVGYLYTVDADGNITFGEEAAYIGEAPNFMEGLKEADEYSPEEMDQRYVELEDDGEGLYNPEANPTEDYAEVEDDGE
ncbi:hypothetical protein [Parvibacter caecicola]|uniref:Uncharacterized protein n=1 Tax=Parvibacter caecicola TaxID=747645 RepID=A0A7W5GPQ5_9ACTN|nr:hypothetical protein [Parvibacter caecicola]MBB3171570.1 hypothetical protein [Parvibacter caecicola]MCR2040829.1 hypothetical protein [Parvibacter caecicola]